MSFQHLITITLVLCFTFTANSAPTLSHRLSRRNAEPIVETKIITEGHDIELDCEADGVSPPVIHWMLDGVYIEQGPWDVQAASLIPPPVPENAVEGEDGHITQSTLLIRQASQANAGKYTCVADTPTERQVKSFNVRVRAAEVGHGERDKRQSEVNPVRIYMWSDQVFEHQGVETILICRATQGKTRTPPTIRWELNGEPITDATKGFMLQSNGDIKFTTTAALHMASIKCTAIGETGTVDTKEPFIYVWEPVNASETTS